VLSGSVAQSVLGGLAAWANNLAAALSGNQFTSKPIAMSNSVDGYSTLCGAPKGQMKSESGFPFSRICPVLLTFCLLSQFLAISVKFVCSGKLA
jgi:hypothetical protein